MSGGWRKPSYSTGSGAACIEVAPGVLVRDSKLGKDSPVLRFTPGAWGAFTARIAAASEGGLQ